MLTNCHTYMSKKLPAQLLSLNMVSLHYWDISTCFTRGRVVIKWCVTQDPVGSMPGISPDACSQRPTRPLSPVPSL